ncbi:MAG: GNAT family N-acetyltransferase [Pseudomonadota bacterium]
MRLTSTNIKVYRATEDEINAVNTIIDEYCNVIGVMVRDTPDQLKKYFHLDSGVWLASHEENIVGCVVLRPLPTLEKSCEVKRLYVRETYRGKHIADALMNALEEYAKNQSYSAAYLDSKDDLQAAIRFYERRGYEVCERYNDNPQATIFMRRQLLQQT